MNDFELTIPDLYYSKGRRYHCCPRREVLEQIHQGQTKVPVQSKTICLLAWHQQTLNDSLKHAPLIKNMTSETKTTTEGNTKTVTTHRSYFVANVVEVWNIIHLLYKFTPNPWSNRQAESAVNIIKGMFTRSKCAGHDPYLALLVYRSTPFDYHLWSTAKMLY